MSTKESDRKVNSIKITTENENPTDLKDMSEDAIYKMIVIMAQAAIDARLGTMTVNGLYDNQGQPTLFGTEKTEKIINIVQQVCAAAKLKHKIVNPAVAVQNKANMMKSK